MIVLDLFARLFGTAVTASPPPLPWLSAAAPAATKSAINGLSIPQRL